MLMARFAIDNRLERAADLQVFDRDGFSYRPGALNHVDWVFAR